MTLQNCDFICFLCSLICFYVLIFELSVLLIAMRFIYTNTPDSVEKSDHGGSVSENEDHIIKKLPLYNGGNHQRGTNVCV